MKYLNLPKNYNGVIPSMFMVKIEQPPPNARVFSRGKGVNKSWFYATGDGLPDWETLKLPHKVGDVVGCRETWTWGYDDFDNNKYVYKSDYNTEELVNMKEHGLTWNSPPTMPKPAIRKWVKVVSAEVKYDDKLNKWVEICAVEETAHEKKLLDK